MRRADRSISAGKIVGPLAETRCCFEMHVLVPVLPDTRITSRPSAAYDANRVPGYTGSTMAAADDLLKTTPLFNRLSAKEEIVRTEKDGFVVLSGSECEAMAME
jgi:hypothetical protein